MNVSFDSAHAPLSGFADLGNAPSAGLIGPDKRPRHGFNALLWYTLLFPVVCLLALWQLVDPVDAVYRQDLN